MGGQICVVSFEASAAVTQGLWGILARSLWLSIVLSMWLNGRCWGEGVVLSSGNY